MANNGDLSSHFILPPETFTRRKIKRFVVARIHFLQQDKPFLNSFFLKEGLLRSLFVFTSRISLSWMWVNANIGHKSAKMPYFGSKQLISTCAQVVCLSHFPLCFSQVCLTATTANQFFQTANNSEEQRTKFFSQTANWAKTVLAL